MLVYIHIDEEPRGSDCEGHLLKVLCIFNLLGKEIRNVLLPVNVLDVDLALLLGKANA